STSADFPLNHTVEVLADSVALKWPGIYERRWRLPRVVDRFLVPATPEPHISCNLRGMAEFQERDVGGAWITRQIRGSDLFVTRSRTPYEVHFQSPPGEELDNLSIHIAVEPFLAALEARYPGSADRVEVVDYFGRDEILWPICLTCAELLAARVPGKSPRAAVGVRTTVMRSTLWLTTGLRQWSQDRERKTPPHGAMIAQEIIFLWDWNSSSCRQLGTGRGHVNTRPDACG